MFSRLGTGFVLPPANQESTPLPHSEDPTLSLERKSPSPFTQPAMLFFPYNSWPAPPIPSHSHSVAPASLTYEGESPWKPTLTPRNIPQIVADELASALRCAKAPRLAPSLLVLIVGQNHELISWVRTHLLQEASLTYSPLCALWLLINVAIPDPEWPSAAIKICPQSSGASGQVG